MSPNDWGVEEVRDACSSLDTVVGGFVVVSKPMIVVCGVKRDGK